MEDSSVLSGSQENIDEALKEMNFPRASSLNPKNMCNNCVSVAIAHMHGYDDVHEFWRLNLHTELPDERLTIPEVADLLFHAGGNWKWFLFRPIKVDDERRNSAAFLNMLGHTGILEPSRWNECIALFVRPDFTGHAINVTFSRYWTAEQVTKARLLSLDRYVKGHDISKYWSFRDYQHSGGDDALADIARATEIMLIVQTPSSPNGYHMTDSRSVWPGQPDAVAVLREAPQF